MVFQSESMFPLDSKILRDEIKIHHTMRVMPEDQNTGGFYVALLRKNAYVTLKKEENKIAEEQVKDIAEEKETTKVKLNDGTSVGITPETPQPQIIKIEKKKREGGYAVPKMDYTPFAKKFPEAWNAVKEMYGFEDVILDLPRTLKTTSMSTLKDKTEFTW